MVGLVAAAEVGDVLAGQVADGALDLALGQPHAEPVDDGESPRLPEGR